MDLEKLSLTNLILLRFLREELQKKNRNLNDSELMSVLLRMQWLVPMELLKEDIPEISETILYKNLVNFHNKIYPELVVALNNETIENLKIFSKLISDNCKKRRDVDETNELNKYKEVQEVIKNL